MAECIQVVEESVCALTKCVDAGSELLDATRKFATQTVSMVDDAIEKVDAIKHAKVAEASKIRGIVDDLQTATKYASTFVKKIDDLYLHCSREEDLVEMKEALMNSEPDFGFLEDLVRQLERTLREAEEFLNEFTKVRDKASKDSSSAAEVCKHQAIRARSRRRATQAVGGTASAVVMATGIGGGVAASIVAGMFTFGIGTIVGLSITAAAATVGGLGIGGTAAAVTAWAANDYHKAEKGFTEIQITFDSMADIASSVKAAVDRVHGQFLHFESLVGDVKDHKENAKKIESICKALDRLWKTYSECYQATSRCHEMVNEIVEKLENMPKSTNS